MYRKLDDFYKGFQSLTEATGKIFSVLSDENLDQAVGEGHRKLGQMAWHIVATYPEMMGHAGLSIPSVDYQSMPPGGAGEIRSAYKAVTAELLDGIRKNWTDESLLEVDEMYGEKWPRGVTLAVLVHHEIHHRAQMTVLLRRRLRR